MKGGRKQNDMLCRQPRPIFTQEEQECHVPCPGDCLVSEWGQWSHCQRNCRIGQIVGYQTSSRRVLFYSNKDSNPCPTKLWRTRPCWSDDCNFFRWKLKNESLICEGRDGIIVEESCKETGSWALKNNSFALDCQAPEDLLHEFQSSVPSARLKTSQAKLHNLVSGSALFPFRKKRE
ncbi:thrombospondin type-1 domain-containing protein 7B [Trichonephila clavipes]|nr:thrombospondin type-1 domain-containing protein 7B [Trichonephila clavipes]